MDTNVELIQVFRREDGKWYYRGRADDGKIVSTSEAYTSQNHATRTASAMFPGIEIEGSQGLL